MDAAFVPCTHSPSSCLQPPVPIRLCVQSPLPGQLKCVYAAGTCKKIVLKIVGLLLLFAILCGAFFRQRFANFALPSFFLFLYFGSRCADLFLVFCFGPTPFGKLMRKFLVKCEISRYFSKHTHSHTQEASECACVLGVCVCVWWFFVCLQVGDYCTLFVWRCLSTKLLVHLSMPLDWWLLCALVQRPAPHPSRTRRSLHPFLRSELPVIWRRQRDGAVHERPINANTRRTRFILHIKSVGKKDIKKY